MLKRLIEVALPLKEVSEQSAREKSIRHGHISTLHIWWARRPLAACRAVVFASLVPDPDDPECPDEFRRLVMDVLGRSEFRPKNGDGSSVEDTPRNRCLEFIKHLVRWENSNNADYIEPARKLIVAAHKFLHPDAEGDAPKVLDPFAGGGAIPLEALRLGCEAHAIDLNPVAHLIELCTLVYPQKYGQPDSRPVPDYIKRLITHNRGKKKGGTPLFDQGNVSVKVEDGEIIPDVEITEAEYKKNPLAADVKYWGHWVLEKAEARLCHLFPEHDNESQSVAFFWARTAKCVDPSCGATMPLIRQQWVAKKADRKIAFRIVPKSDAKTCEFSLAYNEQIDFDPSLGTMQQGKARCPFCGAVADGPYLREQAVKGDMGQQLVVVAYLANGRKKFYSPSCDRQIDAVAASAQHIQERENDCCHGSVSWIPTEPVPAERPAPNSRGLSGVHRYGLDEFHKLFSPRQLAVLLEFTKAVREANQLVAAQQADPEYAKAIGTFLSFSLSKLADRNSTNCVWIPQTEALGHSFSRQALQMVWDYLEINPLDNSWGWLHAFSEYDDNIERLSSSSAGAAAKCARASAARLPYGDGVLDAVVTDPPYYESVPYSDLSDFFYVWLRRAVGDLYPDAMRTPLTPKGPEIIAYYGSGKRKIQKPPSWYEEQMGKAFSEMQRVMTIDALALVMFAHKTTSAWETLIGALLSSGLVVTASWPIHTERMARMVAQGTASLAGSISLVCRPRTTEHIGHWDDVREELKSVASERLEFFWDQGIRGADFFISAIGPALSVFGQYERVTKLSGDEVTVGQFLDEVRALVTNYALAKILKTTQTANIDPESRFYVIWRWSYADAKVPADESFKLAQALGIATEAMWDRTGVLEKKGENVQAMPVAKRMKIENLGDPEADGTPASLIDVLHRLCVFREKNDTEGMAQFLARSRLGNNPALWVVAQAMSDILPDGDKEKQLMQGLLNQQEKLEQAAEQGRLF